MNVVAYKPNIYFQVNNARTKQIARLQREVKVRTVGANILRSSGIVAATTGVFLPIETVGSFFSNILNNPIPVSLCVAAIFAIAGGVGLDKEAEKFAKLLKLAGKKNYKL